MNSLFGRTRLIAMVLAIFTVSTLIGHSLAQQADDWKAPAREARKKNPIPADTASIAAGKVVFTKQCFSCHGPAGHGDGPASKDLNPKPHDLTAQAVQTQSDGELFWKITEGKKPMPSFDKLTTPDERWQVIDYLRTLAK